MKLGSVRCRSTPQSCPLTPSTRCITSACSRHPLRGLAALGLWLRLKHGVIPLEVMPRGLVITFILLVFGGCAVHKIAIPEGAEEYPENATLVVTAIPATAECGGSIVTVATLGIVPSGCVHEYLVHPIGAEEKEILVRVHYIQGLVSLVLAPFPAWSFPSSELTEEQIVRRIKAQ